MFQLPIKCNKHVHTRTRLKGKVIHDMIHENNPTLRILSFHKEGSKNYEFSEENLFDEGTIITYPLLSIV